MHITIIANEVNNVADIRNFGGVWSYYLADALRRQGVDITFAEDLRQLRSNAHTLQHVLVLRQRFTETREPSTLRSMKNQIGGALVQLYDTPQTKHLLVDCAFTVRDDDVPETARAKNHHIGWAADPVLFQPKQTQVTLRILIDHPYYGTGKPKGKHGADRSRAVNLDVARFVNKQLYRRAGWEKCEVKYFAAGRFSDFEAGVIPPYERASMAITDCAPEINRTHVFLVTHSESVGQTALECAMAGALVVTPKNFLPPCRLKTIRHVWYEQDDIPWQTVMAQISPGMSRFEAIKNSWALVAERCIKWFDAFKKDGK